MERANIRANIERFKALLKEPQEAAAYATLKKLLTEHEEKLASLGDSAEKPPAVAEDQSILREPS
ncbi:MAG: hypothetical protein K0R61_3602 [Microvirga sp.]|jgi:hypothetical protein|nr:hypothetical protein [Microvirga sp.]